MERGSSSEHVAALPASTFNEAAHLKLSNVEPNSYNFETLISTRSTVHVFDHRAHFHCTFLTTKDKLGSGFVRKEVVDDFNGTVKPKHTVTTNTDRTEFKNVSVHHTEGGWPKEINPADVDLVDRTKKKMQKEESYLESIHLMSKEAEYLVRHNNTLRLCESCDQNFSAGKKDTTPFANVISVYRCPARPNRPISKITFAPESPGRMVAAYCPYEFDSSFRDHNCEAFFWDIETTARPCGMVRASAQIVDIECHPKDVHSICGALFTGQVATWDQRMIPNPKAVSGFGVSHGDVCTGAKWINSKTGFEFFSCGLDGRIIWWDERNLSQWLDMAYSDPEKGRSEESMSSPITVLEYEHTLPTKFLVGTQYGQVMVFMKKAKTPQDRLVNLYDAHSGSVRSIHRNPIFIKNFMSCGDYHLRIFAEDCRDSGIIWTAPRGSLYTYAHWLPGRPCGLVASRSDGCLEFWDLLIQGVSSIMTVKVSEEALTALWPADGGSHLAVGTVNGDIKLVKVCPSLNRYVKTDKSALASCFDRESRREKYMEQRSREIRLAKKHREARMDDSGIHNRSQRISSPLRGENLLKDKDIFTNLTKA